MSYLLDTHVLVWVLVSPRRLSERVNKILSDPKEEAFVSIVSVWEVSLKYGLGKMKLKGKEPSEIPNAVFEMGFKFLNLDAETAATFYKLPRYNKDPFDRMLAWQAISKNLVLLSKDRGFDDYQKQGLKRVW